MHHHHKDASSPTRNRSTKSIPKKNSIFPELTATDRIMAKQIDHSGKKGPSSKSAATAGKKGKVSTAEKVTSFNAGDKKKKSTMKMQKKH